MAVCQAATTDDDLQQAVRQYGLRKWPAHLVLSAEDYQVLQVERPEVPESEMQQALCWRISDLVSERLEELVVDWFDLPGQKGSARSASVMAVAARRERVAAAVASARRAGLKPSSVGIVPLALRNLMARAPEPKTGVALLMVSTQSSLISFGRGSGVYLSRDVEIGRSHIERQQADAEPGVVPDALMDISLELQRSLDYYDAYFADPPIRELWLADEGQQAMDGLATYLGDNTTLSVRRVDPEMLNVACAGDVTPLEPCLIALGAGLHGTVEASR